MTRLFFAVHRTDSGTREKWNSWSTLLLIIFSTWSHGCDVVMFSLKKQTNPIPITLWIYAFFADAASCLEERLAELNLSTSPQRVFETENEDITSQSDTQSSETGGISMSAFESYIRGMVGSVVSNNVTLVSTVCVTLQRIDKNVATLWLELIKCFK